MLFRSTRNSQYPIGYYNLPHTDDPDSETESIIYYVNDSDGDTVIFNEKPPAKDLSIKHKVSPKQGRLLFFDSSYYHSSTPPRNTDIRLVLNIAFKK